MRRLATRTAAWLMAGAALVIQALAAAPVYADHETRDPLLGGPDVDVLLVTLVLVAAAVALTAFAVGILWWERQDTEAAEQDEQ